MSNIKKVAQRILKTNDTEAIDNLVRRVSSCIPSLASLENMRLQLGRIARGNIPEGRLYRALQNLEE